MTWPKTSAFLLPNYQALSAGRSQFQIGLSRPFKSTTKSELLAKPYLDLLRENATDHDCSSVHASHSEKARKRVPTFIIGLRAAAHFCVLLYRLRSVYGRKCPVFLGFCPVLKMKLATKNPAFAMVCGLPAHFPTFFCY